MAKRLKLHLPWLIWTGIIAVLSLTPGNRLPVFDFEWFSIDTAVHIIMYLVLCFLALIGFYHQKNELSGKVVLYIIVSVIAFGLFIEFLQGNFIYRRFFSWEDFVANSAGAIVGWVAFIGYKKKELNLVRFLQ